MIQALIQRIQNFADVLFAGFTKTAPDGRKVIYPWGFFIRGYVIATEQEEKRLRQGFAVFLVVAAILVGAGHALWGYPGSLGFGALILVGYAMLVTRLTTRMECSAEGTSVTELYRAQARKFHSTALWSWVITGFFLVGFSAVGSIILPETRTDAMFLVGIGTILVAFGGWMLVLRRGAGPPVTDPSPTGESVVAEEAAMFVTGDVGPVRAWVITILGLLFTGVCIFVLVIDPEERLGAFGATLLFGMVAALGIAMLVLRHRDRRR